MSKYIYVKYKGARWKDKVEWYFTGPLDTQDFRAAKSRSIESALELSHDERQEFRSKLYSAGWVEIKL